MALQLWMPLKGNLDNLGLADVGFVADSTATSNNNGKIGKCYQFQGYTGRGIYRDSGITTSEFMDSYINNHSFSIACWVKTSSSSTCVCSLTYGVRLFAGNLTLFCIFTRGSSNNIAINSYGAKSNDNEWHHIVGVYDAEVNNITVYVDGVAGTTVAWSGTGTYSSYWTNGLYIGRDCNNSTLSDNYFFQGLMNDFRVYDHALSQAEIHELALGLVVHYKMDDEYSETTTNLGNTSATYSNQTEGNAYTANSWGGDAGTVTYYKSGGYNNGPYKVYHKTATGSGGIYRKTDNDITIVQGKTYTMSIYVKASRDYTDSTYSFNINGVTSSDSNHYITASSSVHFTTEWTRVERTFTASANDAGTYGEMSIIYNDNATDYYVYFSCFQIEEKDHATPFTSSSRAALTFIQDHSGYQNNGTIVGNLTISNDSPRYDKSLYIIGNTNRIEAFMPNVSDFTYSFWIKRKRVSQSNREMIATGWYGVSFEINPNNTITFKCSCTSSHTERNVTTAHTFNADTWYYITGVHKDGVGSYIYVNGILDKSNLFTDTMSYTTDVINIAYYSSSLYYQGYLSDFRIYSTALSADDILSLYQLGAKIDNKKNLHTFEIEENGYNLLSPYTFPLTFGTNLTYVTLTNGKTVIEDNHFKITRNPNITGTLNGNTGGTLNWCGIIFRNYDNILGFLQGHHYLVCINVKGYSDTAMNDIRINNYCDWPASSLIPITITDNIQIYNPVVAGYNSDTWDTVALYFEINSPLYKILTGESYSTFVKGLSYLSFRDFKFGFTYTTTTSVGTNLVLDNLRLYDVTNLDVLTRIKREGITLTISFIEDGDNGIIKNGDLQSNNIYEI